MAVSLQEDLGDGDITTLATVSAGLKATARVVAREDLVVAGLALFEALAAAMTARGKDGEEAASLCFIKGLADGDRAACGETVCLLGGSARALLALERTFLNYLGRLSGIATMTSTYVGAAGDWGGRILDTRKTTPGHRVLEKWAVSLGGGSNHRQGLFDAVLIKDNHIAAAGSVREAVVQALAKAPEGVGVECECDNLDQLEDALGAGVTSVLLDNFSPSAVAEAVKAVAGRARVEVSGGITLDNVGEYARTGVDDISVGRLTHSATAVDLSMELELE